MNLQITLVWIIFNKTSNKRKLNIMRIEYNKVTLLKKSISKFNMKYH